MTTIIEIIGITTCGTYPSWVDYTIASFHNHVDKIVVVNAGYDIQHPEKGALIPLQREHKLIQKIDVDNKIYEVHPTQEQINEIFSKICVPGQDEYGRSTNMTLATQIAHDLPKDKDVVRYILKLDSDQILYPIKRSFLEHLIKKYPNSTGFRFAQYADYYHDFEHVGSLPDEFTNDGSLLYKSVPNQGYSGQGSPGRIKVDQHPIYTIKTSHMRRISPSDVELYEYYYKRIWYHTYAPNSINEHDYNKKTGKKLTLEQIQKIAHDKAISILYSNGNRIHSIPKDDRIPYEPPLVCSLKPLDYIKNGY